MIDTGVEKLPFLVFYESVFVKFMTATLKVINFYATAIKSPPRVSIINFPKFDFGDLQSSLQISKTNPFSKSLLTRKLKKN